MDSIEEELEEVECTHVFVYDKYNFGEVISGYAEIEALDDEEIYVYTDDEDEVRLFKNKHVHA